MIEIQTFMRRVGASFVRIAVVAGLVWTGGCEASGSPGDDAVSAYRERAMNPPPEIESDRATVEQTEPRVGRRAEETAQLTGSQSEETKRAGLLTGPNVEEHPPTVDILAQIPDPSEADRIFAERLAKIETTAREARVVNQYKRVVERAKQYLAELERPKQARLSLGECIQRALASNYTIRRESYGPALSRTRLVEAEAAFDAIFFLDGSYSNLDKQSASALQGTQTDYRDYSGGIRKLLPTGMQVQTSVKQSRTFAQLTEITSQFTFLNPNYETVFNVSFTQPLLKGFGLDYNRALIHIERLNVQISQEAFIQRVRDTILTVEQAYWNLVAARRSAMVLAETVGQNWVTYQSMQERQAHDATPVELNNSKSRWQSRRVDFIESVKLVRDAEDQLKNLLNDADYLLSEDIEIIPTEIPFTAPVTVDHFAEVRTGIERRSEIRQAKLSIEQTRVQTMRAKNETLPQLNLSFSYDVQGIGVSGDASFDHMSTNRFRSYTVAAAFSYPIGNRGPQAAYRRARMQETQAVVACQQAIDAVVTEINSAIRQLMVRYEQIPPQLDAVLAADNNLRAFQARAEQVSPSYLETELSAVEQVANTRRVLLQVITQYNLALVELEKAKGTLLEYNNIVINDDPSRR